MKVAICALLCIFIVQCSSTQREGEPTNRLNSDDEVKLTPASKAMLRTFYTKVEPYLYNLDSKPDLLLSDLLLIQLTDQEKKTLNAAFPNHANIRCDKKLRCRATVVGKSLTLIASREDYKPKFLLKDKVDMLVRMYDLPNQTRVFEVCRATGIILKHPLRGQLNYDGSKTTYRISSQNGRTVSLEPIEGMYDFGGRPLLFGSDSYPTDNCGKWQDF